MTERKPWGMGWESWVDRKVREAEERGDFDDLRGKGEPLPGQGDPYDADWWLRDFLKREGVSVLPASLQLELDIERELARIAKIPNEVLVRDALLQLNEKIARELPRVTSGPSTRTGTIDADEFVERWRADRSRGGSVISPDS